MVEKKNRKWYHQPEKGYQQIGKEKSRTNRRETKEKD